MQFWKAQLDSRERRRGRGGRGSSRRSPGTGRPRRSTRASRSRPPPSRRWPTSALENGDLDGAIGRFEDLLQGRATAGALARPIRWQLVAAYSAKGAVARAAKREIAALLGDPQEPPTRRARPRGQLLPAPRRGRPPPLAAARHWSLKDPAAPLGAVVTRAFMLAEAKKLAEAAALLRKAIAATQPGQAAGRLLPDARRHRERRAAAAADGPHRAPWPPRPGPRRPSPDSLDLVQAKYRVCSALTAGPKAAIAFVDEGQGRPQGRFRRLLVEIYREQDDFAEAERVVRELLRPRTRRTPRLAGQPGPARRAPGDRGGRAQRPPTRAGSSTRRPPP